MTSTFPTMIPPASKLSTPSQLSPSNRPMGDSQRQLTMPGIPAKIEEPGGMVDLAERLEMMSRQRMAMYQRDLTFGISESSDGLVRRMYDEARLVSLYCQRIERACRLELEQRAEQ